MSLKSFILIKKNRVHLNFLENSVLISDIDTELLTFTPFFGFKNFFDYVIDLIYYRILIWDAYVKTYTECSGGAMIEVLGERLIEISLERSAGG